MLLFFESVLLNESDNANNKKNKKQVKNNYDDYEFGFPHIKEAAKSKYIKLQANRKNV